MNLSTSTLQRLVLAVPLLAATAIFILYLFALDEGAIVTTWLTLAAGLFFAGLALLVRRRGREAAMLTAYVRRLGDGDTTAPLPDDLSGPLHEVGTEIGHLHRGWQQRYEQLAAGIGMTEAIVEALPDPLLLVDGQRNVLRANAAARALFGERMPGRDLATVLRNPDLLVATDAVLGGAASRLVQFNLPVPVERVFEARVKPLRAVGADTRAAPLAVMLALHDITAIKRSEQMRDDFIANASHELRTPLSSLLGFIETLRGPARDDAEAHDRFLGIMYDQASRMSRLVSDLMSLSRIELDEHMRPADQVDVVMNVENVVASLELKARSRGIRLRIEAPDEMPPVIGDEDQLTQVFQNLLTNAIKYTRENTEVTVSLILTDGAMVGGATSIMAGSAGAGGRRGAPMLAVAVADQGEGIARTHLPRLTERFYRVDAARSRAMGGTGLGLAIVKHILNRHRGRLTIESEVGKGSTFTVYLPVAADQAIAVPLGTQARNSAA